MQETDTLADRVRTIREGKPGQGPVAYWMSRDQRVHDNWGLIYAQEMARRQGLPLVVVFCLSSSFPGATLRQYGFMLRGLEKVSAALRRIGVLFFLLPGNPPGALSRFIEENDVSFLVSDFDPLRIKRQWKDEVARAASIPFYEVDTHNIVPCWLASGKREYGAYTIRRKIGRLLPRFLNDFPALKKHPYPMKQQGIFLNASRVLADLRIDRSVNEVRWIRSGEDVARRMLDSFIDTRLGRYEGGRNNPVEGCQSDLSPYLHFGQIAPQRIALEVRKCTAGDQAKEAFLEELVVRRELSDNYCYYTRDYDSFNAFPEWARRTLDEHRGDRRAYLYSREELESSKTHDDLWNAAQKEMVVRGKMHGYMRMYWAKKILEWTPSPEDALLAAIYLNDRYELDGRDPNGYTGIAWSIGGVHDRAWGQRNVFGKIRYMSYNGCASKFSVKGYIQYVSELDR